MISAPLISIVFFILLCFVANSKSIAKQNGSSAKNAGKRPPNLKPNIKEQIRKPEKHDLCKAATVKSYKIGTLGLEDRENDWLAKQLREEAKLKKKILSE